MGDLKIEKKLKSHFSQWEREVIRKTELQSHVKGSVGIYNHYAQ